MEFGGLWCPDENKKNKEKNPENEMVLKYDHITNEIKELKDGMSNLDKKLNETGQSVGQYKENVKKDKKEFEKQRNEFKREITAGITGLSGLLKQDNKNDHEGNKNLKTL